ncbi:Deazaflavin-dependent nitroreductase [Rubrobacter xylanophilus DSM 9941]|uniref:nitroreductase family deazaflavin-dependent oxidoreductase n=1 Tax=Rubrobacter xylanophilus TaxID=49319 RepID=UPI001C644BC5|nr:nitroreductase family deazaflavin-dependent oxidoreductase [Rubrobacter xylanophilus]QYJ16268.1 Deazaflavin-dependent nitroreductase [Rubrobacter xylanophilus DSM 9941]
MFAKDLAEKIGGSRLFATVASKVAPPVDRALYRWLGGRTLGAGPPTLLLTTVGRRTGRQRTVPLLYVRDGERLAVAASNWGRERHPEWSENLLSNPLAWVQAGHTRRRCRARLATSRERERLWPRFIELWPAYESYRRRCGREIRIFLLEDV